MSELSKVAKALNWEGRYGQSLDKKIESIISERNGYRNMCDDLRNKIRDLTVELAGKDAVIQELRNDIAYYRKDRRDQFIQDQGLPTGDA